MMCGSCVSVDVVLSLYDSLFHSVVSLVIISRFELVEIIMHSSHYVVFDNNDWPAARIVMIVDDLA